MAFLTKIRLGLLLWLSLATNCVDSDYFLTGTVTDEDGLALEGAGITLDNDRPFGETTEYTDYFGRYTFSEFDLDFEPRSYRLVLTVNKDGYEAAQENIVLQEAETLIKDIQLTAD